MRIPRNLIPTIHADESATSACSRVASSMGRSAREFCADASLRFGAIVEGRRLELDSLASLCGLGAMPCTPIVRTANGFLISGEEFTRATLVRRTIRVCAECWSQDLREGDRGLRQRPYGRTVWSISSLRTCSIHDRPLTTASDRFSTAPLHDFVLSTSSYYERATTDQSGGTHREPNALETEILQRIDGVRSSDAWIRSQPAYALCRISEMLGAISLFGPHFQNEDLSDDDWWASARDGHAILSGGPQDVLGFLGAFVSSRGTTDVRRYLGRIYEWLAHETTDSAYDPLRDLLHEAIVANAPIGTDRIIVGRPVVRRKVHSLHSLHRETGLHPKRLRKLASRMGTVAEASRHNSDGRVLLDAQDADEMLRELSGSLTLAEAARYLNAPRPHDRLLLVDGFVAPLIRGSKRGELKHAYARSSLAEFLNRLIGDARPMRENEKLVSIPTAARRACCSARSIVSLILGRSLPTIALDPAERGYLSVRVSVEEIRPLVAGTEHGGLTLREVSRELRTSDGVVRTLVDRKHIASRVASNPINKSPQTVVDPLDLAKFVEMYVSLTVLARTSGLHFRSVARRLKEAKIEPAFDPAALGASFFERRRCEDLLDQN